MNHPMPREVRMTMISYREAVGIVRQRAELRSQSRLKEQQQKSLYAAQGQILAAAVKSPELVPPFDNSAMDGFALWAEDSAHATAERPLVLPILASIAAGDPQTAIPAFGAVEIMTGAPMPLGKFDAVIRVEDTAKTASQDQVLIKTSVLSGDNIRRQGSDFNLEQSLAAPGEVVSPELMMACASLGIDTLAVQAPIRIALLITGRELSRFTDKDLPSGMIRDASGPYLQACLQRADFDLIAHKMLLDDPDLFRSEVQKILKLKPDIIISTGAVSMGKYDFIKDGLLELGACLNFHKVAMRPGKPLLFAEWQNGPVWFGLPGNPVSTIVGWRFFVDPYVRALRGQSPEIPWTGRLLHAQKKPKLQCFFKASSAIKDGELQVGVLEGQGSYMISPLLQTSCWAALDTDLEYVEQGSLVSVFPLHAFI
jgi:molybdopterin molybdotransferase